MNKKNLIKRLFEDLSRTEEKLNEARKNGSSLEEIAFLDGISTYIGSLIGPIEEEGPQAWILEKYCEERNVP